LLMDLLCVFDQSFQQRRWRVSEILTKFVKDKLGVRPGVISATAEYCAETTSVTVLQCDDFEAQWHSESARTCKYNADHSGASRDAILRGTQASHQGQRDDLTGSRCACCRVLGVNTYETLKLSTVTDISNATAPTRLDRI